MSDNIEQQEIKKEDQILFRIKKLSFHKFFLDTCSIERGSRICKKDEVITYMFVQGLLINPLSEIGREAELKKTVSTRIFQNFTQMQEMYSLFRK